MVAYSFQRRFKDPIYRGVKRQTVRADRKRHARPGEMLQLFTGMRTRQCAKIIDDQRCTAVLPVEIRFDPASGIVNILTGGVPVRSLDDFAVRDGFTDIQDMSAFWNQQHDIQPGGVFCGVVIEWQFCVASPVMPDLDKLGAFA